MVPAGISSHNATKSRRHTARRQCYWVSSKRTRHFLAYRGSSLGGTTPAQVVGARGPSAGHQRTGAQRGAKDAPVKEGSRSDGDDGSVTLFLSFSGEGHRLLRFQVPCTIHAQSQHALAHAQRLARNAGVITVWRNVVAARRVHVSSWHVLPPSPRTLERRKAKRCRPRVITASVKAKRCRPRVAMITASAIL